VLGSGAESSTSGTPPHRRRILERGEAKEDLAKYYDIPANIPRLGRGECRARARVSRIAAS